MAWATKIATSEQVEYRLTEDCHCDAEQKVKVEIDQQVEYRLKQDLRWIGSGLSDVGLVAGGVVDKDQARALMDSTHPHTGQQLIAPKKEYAAAARLAAIPFVAAIRELAATAGIEGGDVWASPTAAARWARLERGLLRDGERHTIPIKDLERLAASLRPGLGVGGKLPLEDVYPGEDLARARANRNVKVRVDIRGIDVVMDLPKSVSVLHALVDADTATAIETEYLAAVAETVLALESWASYGVSGHQGGGKLAQRVESSGLMGWTMLHRSARPVGERVGDPHLHAHVVLAHMVKCVDGGWRVPGSGGLDISRHVPAVGELVKARVRARLTHRFGVGWAQDESTGAWEIAGIPLRLREEFSGRHRQLAATLGTIAPTRPGQDAGEDAGEGGGGTGGEDSRRARVAGTPAQQRDAAVQLAEARPEVERADVRQLWRATAQSVVGDVDAMVAAVMPGPSSGPPSVRGPDGPGPVLGPGSPAPVLPGPGQAYAARAVDVPDIEEIVARVWTGEQALTAHAKTVTRVHVLAAVAAACPAGVTDVEQLEALTDAVIAAGPTVAADPLRASHHSNTARWTTRDIVEAEHTVTTAAAARLHAAAAVVDPVVAEATVTTWAAARRPAVTLSPEQLAVVARLTTAGHGVDAVIGVAGAGKTTLMAATRTVWEQAGYTVAGASTAAVASAGLAAEAGIRSRTVASWLTELDDPSLPGLREVDVLVVDEAAMLDDRELARLITAATVSPTNPAGTKIVLIGDPLQLRAIGVGGTFQAVHDIVDGTQLRQNRRQQNPIDRTALQTWRDGGRREALDQLAIAGRIHATELPEQALAEMLTAWQESRSRWDGDPHAQLAGLALLAARNSDVDTLNDGARALRIQAGELGPQAVYQRTAAAGGGSLTLATGDLVRVRINDYRSRYRDEHGGPQPDVLNGYRGVVVAINEQRQVQIQWRRPDPDRPDQLLTHDACYTPAQIGDGHLSHGYAMTIAASQGMTCDLTIASGIGADAHSLYPALTRARQETHLWLCRDVVEDPAVLAVLGPATDTDRLPRTVAAHADTIEHDRPDTLVSDQLLHPDPAGDAVRDLLQDARRHADTRRNHEPDAPALNKLDGPDDGRDAELPEVAELLRASHPDPAPVPDAQPVRQAAAAARQPAAEQRDPVDQGARDSAGRSLADLVASLTDEQRQEAQHRWEARDPDRAQHPQATPEPAGITPWQQRPYGHIPTKHLPVLRDQAQTQARRFDDAADRIETDLRTASVPARLGVARALLQHADTSQAAADSAHAHVVQLASQIHAAYEANRRDDIARQIAQAKADRLLAGLTGRHARTVADLTTQIHARIEQINGFTASQHHLREIETTRAEQARALRQQAGAHPNESTEDTLTRLTRKYTAEDQNNRASADSYRRAAQQQRTTITQLGDETALRRDLSPAATAVEDTARTAAGIAAAQAAKQAAETAARIRADHDRHYRPPTPGPSRGPSLGR